MTHLELIHLHHAEQMEAARWNFEQSWRDKILPSIIGLAQGAESKITDRELGMAYHCAWVGFLAGTGIKPPVSSPVIKPRHDWALVIAHIQAGSQVEVRNARERKCLLMAAARKGVAVTSRRLTGGGYRVWKL